MTQRPATVIAAIALKYALREAHLSESEIGFFWMQRRQDTRRRPRKLPRQNQPNANPRTIMSGQQDRENNMTHVARSEAHTSELQSLMRQSYAVFCLKTKI